MHSVPADQIALRGAIFATLVIAMYVLRMYDTQPEYLQPVTKKKVHTEHSQSLNMTAPPLTPASGPTLALPTSRKPNFM